MIKIAKIWQQSNDQSRKKITFIFEHDHLDCFTQYFTKSLQTIQCQTFRCFEEVEAISSSDSSKHLNQTNQNLQLKKKKKEWSLYAQKSYPQLQASIQFLKTTHKPTSTSPENAATPHLQQITYQKLTNDTPSCCSTAKTQKQLHYSSFFKHLNGILTTPPNNRYFRNSFIIRLEEIFKKP